MRVGSIGIRRLKFGLALALGLVCLLAGRPGEAARAAPVAPGLSAGVAPFDFAPGQAGFASVGGAYPLQVEISLDGKPLEVFWSGGDYRAVFAFSIDEPPGSHTIDIQALNPVGGETIQQSYPLTVHATGFPSDFVNVPNNLFPLLDKKLNQSETDALTAITTPHTHPATFPWPFAMPVPDAIEISGYGDYRIYNGGVLNSRHLGVDLRRAIGDPVLATADGRVAAAQLFPIHGNAVIIDHGFGVYSLYAHLSQFKVTPGQWVRQGQLIGLAGATGRAAGPHSHFEIFVDGMEVDPIKWLALAPGFVPPQQQILANPPGA